MTTKTNTPYIQSHAPSVTSCHAHRTAQNACKHFTLLLQPSFRILDVGCGPGSITTSLAPFVPQGSVTGIDASASVIAHAQSQPNVPENCTFSVADVTSHLPFADDTFDVVHTSQVLIHLVDVDAAFRELRRVCKKNGGFVACREADDLGTIVYPANGGISKWIEALHATRDKAGMKLQGRQLLGLALRNGFEAEDVLFSMDSQTFAGTEGRVFYGEGFAERMRSDETWRRSVVESGVGTEADLEEMREGWLEFARTEEAVWSMPCGQVVCFKR